MVRQLALKPPVHFVNFRSIISLEFEQRKNILYRSSRMKTLKNLGNLVLAHFELYTMENGGGVMWLLRELRKAVLRDDLLS